MEIMDIIGEIINKNLEERGWKPLKGLSGRGSGWYKESPFQFKKSKKFKAKCIIEVSK